MARLTTDMKRFDGGLLRFVFAAAELACIFAAGALVGAGVQHQSQCPRITHRTISTPALILQDGIWTAERKVAERAER